MIYIFLGLLAAGFSFFILAIFKEFLKSVEGNVK